MGNDIPDLPELSAGNNIYLFPVLIRYESILTIRIPQIPGANTINSTDDTTGCGKTLPAEPECAAQCLYERNK